MRFLEVRRHTMRMKPGQHLTQAGVDLARRVGSTMGPFNCTITSTLGRSYETAIAMGFAVNDQLEELAHIPDHVLAETPWDAGFGKIAEAVRQGGNAARFAEGQYQLWKMIVESIPDSGAALVITHGGIVEFGAVACMPEADHTSWGLYCLYCEGVRLSYENERFQSAQILRVESVKNPPA